MKKDIERRNFQLKELRAITDDKGLRHITGYAAVFDKLSEDIGWGFREKIQAGAFSEAIKSDDVRALWNHDPNYVMGRNKSGTLLLSEDEHGLKIDVDPPDTQWTRDLMTSIDRGDVDQMSFGFRTISDKWETIDEVEIRTLVKVKLFDISVVAFPAYPDTSVGLRSLEEYKKTAPSAGVGGVEANVFMALLGEEDELYRVINS